MTETEADRLRADAAITVFLSRPDIRIMIGSDGRFRVREQHGKFWGTSFNLIVAARMAMLQARKLETAEKGKEKKTEVERLREQLAKAEAILDVLADEHVRERYYGAARELRDV